MTKLIILESNLGVEGGHYQTTPLAISRTYPQYEHHLLCDGPLPAAYRGAIRSVNTSLAKVEWKSVNDPSATLFQKLKLHTRRGLGVKKSFEDAMLAYLQALKVAKSDHLLIPSCSHRLLRSVIQLLQGTLSPELPTIHIRCIFETVPFDYMKEFGVDTLRSLVDQKKLFLYTETNAHSAVLLDQFGIAASDTLIIPCNIYPDTDLPEPSFAASGPGRPLTVGVFGEPRIDKGSDRIAPIVEELRMLLATHREITPVDVVMQVSASSVAQKDGICNRLHSLPELGNGVRLRFLETGISRGEYVRQLLGCDALLLPYLVDRRRCQGSGIVLDAVFAKRPVIHTKGIAFDEYLDHGNAMQAVSDTEFAEKICALARNRDALSQGTERAYAFARQKILNPPLLEQANEKDQ